MEEHGEAKCLSTEEAREAIAGRDRSIAVVDVRSSEQFGDGHVPGAINVDDGDAEAVEAALAEQDEADEVLIVCEDGERSRELASQLGEGRDVAYLDGGMKEWHKKHAIEPPPAETEYEGPKKKTLY
jgi:rhodanese-related sulfurtransferase